MKERRTVRMQGRGFLLSTTLQALALALSGFPGTVSAQSNTLTLNIGQATYKIERAMYGHLWENLGRDIYNGVYVGEKSSIPNTRGFRNDILQAFIEQGMPCLEWPGGCAVWSYHWRDGIGPKASRPGGEMVNGVGTAEYFDICKLINAEPYITCNINTATVSENTDWLNYIDSTPEWKNSLKYWKLGNEEWGACGSGPYTVRDFIAKYKRHVAGIPPGWANKLVRIAEAGTDPAWASVVMDSLMGKMEAISYHYYSVNWGAKGSSISFNDSAYYWELQSAWGLEAKLKGFETVMNQKDPNYTLGIMVDEWGAWYDQLPGMGALYQQSSVRDAVLAVLSLNILNNHCRRVKMALAAQAVNVIFASILTQTSPGTAMVKTPTYYVLKMLKPFQNAKMIPVNLTTPNVTYRQISIPTLSASACIDSAKNVHISLGNHHATTPQTLTITLSGTSTSYSQVTGKIVNGPAITSINDFNKPEAVTLQDFPSSNYSLSGTNLTVTLPAHSAVMLTLPYPTGIASRKAGRMPDNLSVKAAAGGKIIVSTAAALKTPMRLTLCTTDGRTIAKTIMGNADGETSRIEWRPGIDGFGAGVYVLKVQADGVSESQRVALTR